MKTIWKKQVGYFEVMNEVVQNSMTHMEEGMYSPVEKMYTPSVYTIAKESAGS